MTRAAALKSYHVGVDLGQRRDHTAVVVVEQRVEATGMRDAVRHEWMFERKLVVVYVEQVRLGTRYAEIGKRLEKLTQELVGRADKLTVAIDATGLGGVVMEYLEERKLAGEVMPVVFTGGQAMHYSDSRYLTPKADLMTGLLRAFEVEGLCVARGVAGWDLVEEELLGMRKVGSKYECAGKHDDLVMGLALALFGARRRMLPTRAALIRRRKE